VRWIASVARGDLGWSILQGRPVRDVLADALPNTILLVGTALAAGFAAGIGAGVFQAALRARGSRGGRRADRALGAVTVFFFSIPEFWLAISLLVLFTLVVGVLPSMGATSIEYEYLSTLERLLDRLAHLFLPALTLALGCSPSSRATSAPRCWRSRGRTSCARPARRASPSAPCCCVTRCATRSSP
jgi:peptide/nickel transport system permease protein